MSNNFLEDFATGFMTRTATGIDKRLEKADDYFEQRMEMARTVGLQSRAKVMEQANQGIISAKQLQQAGVPKDIVIAIAKQNPDDLPSFLEQVQKLQAKGVKTDEPFFRQLIQVSGEAGLEGESIQSVFNKIYTPLSNAAKNNSNFINTDPSGSIFASLLGYDAMDNARNRLENDPIIGNMTAEDLIAFGDSSPNIGGPTVTMNASYMGEQMDALESDDPSINERFTITKAFEEEYDRLRTEWMEKNKIGWADAGDAFPEAELRREAADRVGNVAPEIYDIPEIFKWFEVDEKGSVPPPVLSDGKRYVKTLEDGSVVYVDEEGNYSRYDPSTLPH